MQSTNQTSPVLMHQDTVFRIGRSLKQQLNWNLYKNNGTLLWWNITIKNRYIWFKTNINLPSVQSQTYKEQEFCQACERRILDKSSYSEILGGFGGPKSMLTYFLDAILTPLKYSSLKHLWYLVGVEKNDKDNSQRSDRENSCYKKREGKLTFSSTKKNKLWQHHKYMGYMDYQEIYRPHL